MKIAIRRRWIHFRIRFRELRYWIHRYFWTFIGRVGRYIAFRGIAMDLASRRRIGTPVEKKNGSDSRWDRIESL